MSLMSGDKFFYALPPCMELHLQSTSRIHLCSDVIPDIAVQTF